MMKKFYFILLGACIALGSCSTGDAASAAQMAGGSSHALLYLNCRAVSEDEIEFEFSRPVTVKSINIEPAVDVASIQNGSTVRVRLEKIPEPGKLLVTDLLAEDEKKNTINVLVSFRSRNNRMPSLVINEIFTEYSSSAKKTEFIELKMKSDGNLGAMRIVILGNSNTSKQTVYEFLPCEVRRNDYVVLHLRTLEETCKNEYGSNLLESGGTNASNARDFWIPGNTKLIQRTTSTVYVLDQDDRVLDAVMICEKPDVSWSKDYFTQAAEFLFSGNAWKSADGEICIPAEAVISTGITATRSISRKENADDTNTAADWYITASGKMTPGKPNE
jgi:hypothetical protein